MKLLIFCYEIKDEIFFFYLNLIMSIEYFFQGVYYINKLWLLGFYCFISMCISINSFSRYDEN